MLNTGKIWYSTKVQRLSLIRHQRSALSQLGPARGSGVHAADAIQIVCALRHDKNCRQRYQELAFAH
jgi:hypothetical protein